MRTLIAFVTAVFLVACGGGGDGAGDTTAAADTSAYDGTAAQLIQRGMTQDEVRNRLGEPRTRVQMNAGLERWTYYAYDAQGQLAARTMIVFGGDGSVADVTHAQR